MGSLSIALLHHPVYNKAGKIVTTAVANTDIHDIARSAKTFGAGRYYIVTPLESQQEYVAKIINHWIIGHGAIFNPSRREALSLCRIKTDLAECFQDFSASPFVVATTANTPRNKKALACEDLASMMKNISKDVLMLFGTGWGLAQEVFEEADAILEPIRGYDDYNHLSVRAAVVIYLSRVMGFDERDQKQHHK